MKDLIKITVWALGIYGLYKFVKWGQKEIEYKRDENDRR